MLLRDKVALITGATSGIGRAGALIFAKEGANVIIVGRNEKEGEKIVDAIKGQGNKAAFIRADLSLVDGIEHMVGTAAEIYDRIDIFWHNAGAYFAGHIDLIEEEHYDREMTIGLKAAVFGTKLVIPIMRKTGGGSILYTSSMLGLRPSPYTPGNSITHGLGKAGMVMLTRCLTEPLARSNIRVNCICPGPVETKEWKAGIVDKAKATDIDPEEYYNLSLERLPSKKNITEEEVANAAAFLVSDKASGITGAAFPVDGGFSAI